jgi:asparaginyl-tRNA synthetase
MDTAEGCVKHAVSNALEACSEDMTFFRERVDRDCLARAEATVAKPFARIEYSDAIRILKDSGMTFAQPVTTLLSLVWCDVSVSIGHVTFRGGCGQVNYDNGLSTEQERYLAEVYCKGPVFVMNYPASIKPFYMRQNDDGNTVGCIDMLVPRVGELVGGSERETRLPNLLAAMRARGLYDDNEDKGLNWYVDLRRYGGVPLAGWGMGFERLVQYVTGMLGCLRVRVCVRTSVLTATGRRCRH